MNKNIQSWGTRGTIDRKVHEYFESFWEIIARKKYGLKATAFEGNFRFFLDVLMEDHPYTRTHTNLYQYTCM